MALDEDCCKADILTNWLIPKDNLSKAHISAKQNGVLSGIEIAKRVFTRLDKNMEFKSSYCDGDRFKKGAKIVSLKGKTRAILTGERTALNFLSYLSGIATNTNNFVREVKSCKVKILNTRKTTPGLRKLEMYAVLCGGGSCHRKSLKEMFILKDNHRIACPDKNRLYKKIQELKKINKQPIIIEVDTLNQFRQVLKLSPDIILLDNMSIPNMKYAVEYNKMQSKSKIILLEASGRITLDKVKNVAKTGVDRISIGELSQTHKNINLSLELVK